MAMMCRDGREVSASAVPGHDQLFRVPAETIDVRGYPLDRGDGVLNPCRVGVFGREPVIHLHDVRPGACGDTAPIRVSPRQRALTPSNQHTTASVYALSFATSRTGMPASQFVLASTLGAVFSLVTLPLWA